MKRTSTRLTTAVILLGASFNGLALGLGGLRDAAVLGRPLDLTVPLRVESGDNFSGECVSAEVSLGEVRLPRSAVHARVEPTKAGGHAVRVTTDVPVEEPVVTMSVSAGCQARVSRTYTVFADPPVAAPPVMAQAPAAAPAPAPPLPAQPARRAATAPAAQARAEAGSAAPTVASAPAAASERTPAQRAAKPQTAKPRTTPRPVARATPAAPKPAAPPERRSAPRLQLDLLDAELAEPALRLSDELSAPEARTPEERQAAAAAWQALSASAEERVRDNERLLALERSLLEMRAETARTRESLDRLQAQLRQAEEGRFANPLVYLLVLICGLLAAALAWVLRRQPGRHAWWAPSALVPESRRGELSEGQARRAGRAAAPPAEAEITSPDAKMADAASTANRRQQAAAAAAQAAQSTPAASRGPMFLHSRPPEDAGGPNKVSVEELIDLEQQAEFFVALGQEESAVELLRSHVHGHPDGSPLPYLKLLEIFQRRGERQPYEEIRAQFNERFNAYAPAWEDALSDGRSLEDYPTVISRLQALWESPTRALEVLQASLLRRDASSQTFDLPAYRELLMLYSVARDRVEGSPETEIDVLLPLGDEGSDDFPRSLLEPLMATTPVKPYEGALPEPHVDVELEPQDQPPPAHAGSASIDFATIHLDMPDDTPRR